MAEDIRKSLVDISRPYPLVINRDREGGGTLELSVAEEIGRGASCIAYMAFEKSGETRILKELYPLGSNVAGIARDEKTALLAIPDDEISAFEEWRSRFKGTIDKFDEYWEWDSGLHEAPRPFEYGSANGTLYAVSDPPSGNLLTDEPPSNMHDIAEVMLSICNALKSFHEHRDNEGNPDPLLYLDLKPDNLYSYELDGVNHVLLFDFDTVIRAADLKERNYKYSSYSVGWAPPEQVRWRTSKITEASDTYSVGAVFFWLVTGNRPTRSGDEGLECTSDLDLIKEGEFRWAFEKRKDLAFDYSGDMQDKVSEIIGKTLVENPSKRCSSISDLASDFETLCSITLRDKTLADITREESAALMSATQESKDEIIHSVSSVESVVKESIAKLRSFEQEARAGFAKLDKVLLYFEELPIQKNGGAQPTDSVPGFSVTDRPISRANNELDDTPEIAQSSSCFSDEPQSATEKVFAAGLAYLIGDGVKADSEHAVMLIEKAARDGLPQAYEKLISIYETGDNVQKDLHEAIVWQNRYIELISGFYQENSSEDNYSLLFRNILNLGKEYQAMGKPYMAVQAYDRARQVVVNRQTVDCRPIVIWDLAVCTDRLGNAYKLCGERVEAEQSLRESLSLWEKVIEIEESSVAQRNLANAMMNLGDILIEEGRAAEAESLFERSHEIRMVLHAEQRTDQSIRDLALGYERLGMARCDQGDLSDALNLYDRALELRSSLVEDGINPEDFNCMTTVLIKVDSILEKLNEHAKAEQLFRRAIKIGESLLADAAANDAWDGLFRAYCALGQTLLAEGRVTEAEELFRKSIEIGEEHVSEAGYLNKRSLALRYGYFCETSYSAGDYDSAEKWCQKALLIDEGKTTELGDNAAQSFDDLRFDYAFLGKIARARGDVQKAEPLYQKACAAGRKAKALSNSSKYAGGFAETSEWFAWCLKENGNLTAAEKAYSEAADSLRSVVSSDNSIENSRRLARNIEWIGWLESNRGATAAAQAHYLEALKVHEEVAEITGAMNDYMAMYRCGDILGRSLHSSKEYAGAEEAFRKSVTAGRFLNNGDSSVKNRRNLAKGIEWLGVSIRDQIPKGSARSSEAEDAYHEALLLYEMLFNETGDISDNEAADRCRINLGTLLFESLMKELDVATIETAVATDSIQKLTPDQKDRLAKALRKKARIIRSDAIKSGESRYSIRPATQAAQMESLADEVVAETMVAEAAIVTPTVNESNADANKYPDRFDQTIKQDELSFASVSQKSTASKTDAWGPKERETFTCANEAPYPVFNSFTDNPSLGDERNFVRVREAGTHDTFTDNVDIVPGKKYEVYVYYHNNARAELNKTGEGVADNVRLSMAFPTRVYAGEAAVVKGTISSTNTTIESVFDSAFLHASEAINLRYIAILR